MAVDPLSASSTALNGTDNPTSASPDNIATFQNFLNSLQPKVIAFQPSPGTLKDAPTVTIPGAQNPAVGVPAGYGQPGSIPSGGQFTPGSSGTGQYISPIPSAGLDGLIQEGLGSMEQTMRMSRIDSLISIARGSADGRATTTLPVGRWDNPNGYVNVTYDRNNGMLYTSDLSGSNKTLYPYVPIQNLIGRLALPGANSPQLNPYKSLNWALSTPNGTAPAYDVPSSSKPVTQPAPPQASTPVIDPGQPAQIGDVVGDPYVNSQTNYNTLTTRAAIFNANSNGKVALAIQVRHTPGGPATIDYFENLTPSEGYYTVDKPIA